MPAYLDEFNNFLGSPPPASSNTTRTGTSAFHLQLPCLDASVVCSSSLQSRSSMGWSTALRPPSWACLPRVPVSWTYPERSSCVVVLCSFMRWLVRSSQQQGHGRKTKSTIITDPKTEACHGRQGHVRNTCFYSGGRRQELGENQAWRHYWGFCGKGKAGQGKPFRTGQCE